MKIGSYGFTKENLNRGKPPWVIYHNPRCSKSREALDLLRANSIDPQIIEYLHVPLRKLDIESLISLLKVDPKEIIRTKEKVFSTLNVDLTSPSSIAEAIVAHPELLERPIIVHGDKAVIGRPPEKALELLD